MGGNIRGNADYATGAFFSLEALQAEIQSDEVVATVAMPGWLVAEGIAETHAGPPIPGWMQYDAGIQKDANGTVVKINRAPLDPERLYRVLTKISDLTNGQSPAWTRYYQAHPHLLPPKGAYRNIQSELLNYFARTLWRRLWQGLANANDDSQQELPPDQAVLRALDTSGDGVVSRTELLAALQTHLQVSVDATEYTLAHFMLAFCDLTQNGKVTLQDFTLYAQRIQNDMNDDAICQDGIDDQ